LKRAHETTEQTTRARRAWLRRAVTLPALGVFVALALGAAPIWLPAAVGLDLLTRSRTAWLRAGLFLTWLLCCESAGVIASAILWLGARVPGVSRDRFLAWNFALQVAWTRALLGGATLLFRLRFRVTGSDAVARGPAIVLVRHVSVADTLLPAVFISAVHGLRLRYVLKRGLLWDPCLDIVGNRLPNAFVKRAAEGDADEIAKVQALAHDLGKDEAVLIFPEGTRFTPDKRARVLHRLRERAGDDLPGRRVLAAAECLEHVLPPQLGGVTAALTAAPTADVVFCGHTGFEGIATLRDLVDGRLIGRTVHIHFWRVPRARVPADNVARVDWLLSEWSDVDVWIRDTVRALPPAPA